MDAKDYLVAGLGGAAKGYLKNAQQENQQDELKRRENLLLKKEEMKILAAQRLAELKIQSSQAETKDDQRFQFDLADKKTENLITLEKFKNDGEVDKSGVSPSDKKKDIKFLRTEYSKYRKDSLNNSDTPDNFKDWAGDAYPEMFSEHFNEPAADILTGKEVDPMDKFFSRIKKGAETETPGNMDTMPQDKLAGMPDISEPAPLTEQDALDIDSKTIKANAQKIAESTDDNVMIKLADRIGASKDQDLIAKLWDILNKRFDALRKK